MDFSLQNMLVALGQLLLGGLFVFTGLNNFGPLGDRAAAGLKARGIPSPREVLKVASVFEVVAGACLMLGAMVAPAALALALYTLVASYVLSNFWEQPLGETREVMHRTFIANIAIVGGLLLAAAQAL
ncbi:DoxX family membrane protein [Hyphomicrobium sp. D-2]|uniref:DoxX family membrane protein n=1 Tax=Hyphomicrobium sp. D-2 TaxID=3041621 RepID=UPI002457C409|nr:DoxX family membrane protein [Hyphomicrobium sp. D-2]MDH4983810.1 DoxX family membrane protein [Hyphomicrobium sp. D-2]